MSPSELSLGALRRASSTEAATDSGIFTSEIKDANGLFVEYD